MTKNNNAEHKDEKQDEKSKKKASWKIIVAMIIAGVLLGVGISFMMGAYGDTGVIYQRRFAWIKGYDEIRVHANGDVFCDEKGMDDARADPEWKLIKKLDKDQLKEFNEKLKALNDGEMKSYVENSIGCFHTKVTGD